MPFNSYPFILLFMPAAVAGYWLLRRFAGGSVASKWLLLASVAFYAQASLKGLALIAPSIFLDYLLARALVRLDTAQEKRRKVLFVCGIVANVAFLGYFKYKNFFLDTLSIAFATHVQPEHLLVPLGLSFLVFQKIAFLADVQSRQVQAVRLQDFLLFILFFPRVIAGPIVHYEQIVPQLKNPPRSFIAAMTVGVCLFSIGLFKKTVIADSIGVFVPAAFDVTLPDQRPGLLTAWCGVLAYTFQLYFDFSGYSDMALGIARMFGVRLPMNFNSPLKASSIIEFWRRWHITLTRFLTAYIYTPLVLHLTRARVSKGMPVLRGKRSTFSAIVVLIAVPTLVTMTISGLWHGAGWQFVVWGALHGAYLALNQGWRLLRPRVWPDHASYESAMRPIGFVLTFGAVVIALVFFRAPSVASAVSVLGAMSGMNGFMPYDVEVLQRLGVGVPWAMLGELQPIAPFVWIVAALLITTLLPNSLELLRRFRPALDFPSERQRAPAAQTPLAGRLHAAARKLVRLKHEGIDLGHLSATIVAGLFVLALIAIGRGGAFLYYRF